MYLTTGAPLTVQDLQTRGFTAVEITRLEELKARYGPYLEYCASDRSTSSFASSGGATNRARSRRRSLAHYNTQHHQ
jgi:hypothetical protein